MGGGPSKADEGKYGLQYFDKPNQGIYGKDDDQKEDEIDNDAFDVQACENDCCDLDCECDDCLRCSTNNMRTDDPVYYGAAAA